MSTIDFIVPEITQGDLIAFSDNRVNLKSDYAQRYRDQVNILRDHLDRYISEHPDLGLVKMQLSGSLAKATALSTIRDIDVAVYIKGGDAPEDLASLLEWLAERLRKTYHQIPGDAIKVDGPCVVISYSVTGIKIEVAPIYYEGDPQWRGFLWDRSSGARIMTSIPLHLDFVRQRKEKHPKHFAQVVRLLKWWASQRARDTQGFRLRSFLIELIVAKVSDQGSAFVDYHEALEAVFVYIQKSGLKERISFGDNYSSSALPVTRCGIVEIFDPVNPQNNVAADVTEPERRLLVDLAEQALDALSYARSSQTKGDAIQCWRDLLGASFNA